MYDEYNRKGYDRHINNADQYRKYVNNLEWNNRKGRGERWNMDEIIKRSDINFDEEDFTPYDYAYSVNMMYADYGDMTDDQRYYRQMGKNYLRNDNYPERGGERAYYDAQRRNYRNNNRYYNDGSYEQYEYHPKSVPTIDARYDGYNKYYSYDRRADRDNDGRYNEGR